ncbi:MAG: DUF5063 domain-containing protein [Prolixibacteraceae bacterium]|jgi:hypothetical protein|nr:DUF5063 domain-containing protein [Prolixibacteraceae bacterium]
MKDSSLNSVVYAKNVIEFVTVAGEYCKFVEKAGKNGTRDFLEKIQKILPLLYLKTSLLPDLEPEMEESPEKFVSELDYTIIQQKIAGITGEYDEYQEVFDPGMQFSESALTASISEDLTDIYQDLKDFVSLYRIGNETTMEAGLWECRNNFREFWGQKLVNCLRAVHQLVFSDIDFEGQQTIRFKSEEEEETEGPAWLNRKFRNEEK